MTPEALGELEDFPRAGVILRLALGKSKLESQFLSKSWARYFPDVPEWEAEMHECLLPLPAWFWEMYGEPVHDFLGFAFEFHKAVEMLSSLGRRSPDQLGESEKSVIYSATQSLNGVLNPVAPSVSVGREGGLQ